ncbi:hypothetical protein ACYOEI_11195 [Singulisphaera rosea]
MSLLTPDATTLAMMRALLAHYRANRLADVSARHRILAELKATLPAEAVDDLAYETIVARWQRAIEEVAS